MIYHILNGDELANRFDIDGQTIVCREIFIEGECQADSLQDFWQCRATFIKKTYAEDTYLENVKSEFDKLSLIQASDEVNFWFGNEAFCQVNLWFCINLCLTKNATLYRVFPDSDDWHCRFTDLQNQYKSRQKLAAADLQLAANLWQAFATKDSELMHHLGKTTSASVIGLNEVCHALIEKDWKPKEILNEITQNGESDFNNIVSQFQQKAGIYGFGDLQIKRLLEAGSQ